MFWSENGSKLCHFALKLGKDFSEKKHKSEFARRFRLSLSCHRVFRLQLKKKERGVIENSRTLLKLQRKAT